MWTPITFNDLYDMVIATENRLMGEPAGLWKLIKIVPEKWQEKHYYGKEDAGFWVVAICGYRVVWYNDIEEGFYISGYNKYGEIGEGYSSRNSLDEAINQLLHNIKYN